MFGNFFSKMNIPLDRKSRMSGHRAIIRASEDIKKGISITLFPEGGIIATPTKLGKFKNGPFKLAISNQVAIVPISFLNNWEILPDGEETNTGGWPGRARVIIHKAIETQGMTDANLSGLKEETFNVIQKSLDNYGSNK